eukprot:GHVP01013963.1.p1 GENE.GHVP01013963.1~~GHVP01013963.1.p1  ORF type:complete len:754 (+),score=137.53 GHVP01013963.1:704-2965(+)
MAIEEDEDESSLWTTLVNGIRSIFSMEEGKLSFINLYRCAYKLVSEKKGEALYSLICGEIETHLDFSVLKALRDPPDSRMVSTEFVEQWEKFRKCLSSISDVLMYLNRSYCKAANKTLVYQKGLSIFLNKMKYEDIWSTIESQMLSEIQKARIGEFAKSDVVSYLGCLSTLDEEIQPTPDLLSRFRTKVETKSKVFHAVSSESKFSSLTVDRFTEECINVIQLEEKLASLVLPAPHLWENLVSIARKEWAEDRFGQITMDPENGIRSLLLQKEDKKLQNILELFRNKDNDLWSEILQILSSSIVLEGQKIVDKRRKISPLSFVEEFLTFSKSYQIRVVEIFQSKNAEKQFRKALEIILNSTSFDFPEILAVYLDDLLSKNSLSLSLPEIEERISDCLGLFRHISDKDVFESYYHECLAKRLLSPSNQISESLEAKFVQLLSKECGHVFTARLERMFRDIRTSVSLRTEFEDNFYQDMYEKPMLKPVILTGGTWPLPKLPICTQAIPKALSTQTSLFSTFFEKKYEGRRLIWNFALGHADVLFRCDCREFILSCTTYQMIILLLFNSREELKFDEIQALSDIPPDALRLHLAGLHANLVSKILMREGLDGKDVRALREKPEDRYFVNNDFDHKNTRVRIRLPIPKKTDWSGSSDDSKIKGPDESRNLKIDSTIVRLMKTNRVMKHQDVIKSTLSELSQYSTYEYSEETLESTAEEPHPRFSVCQAAVKRRIEFLLEREFLRRDSSELDMYMYQV